MTDKELRLNSVDRYLKSSPNFVLEEHGHCEVPAGCGGVVLRWRNPAESIPVMFELTLFGVDERVIRLNGARLPSARPLLPAGRHTVSVSVQTETPVVVRLLFRAVADFGERSLLISSGQPDLWRWTDEEPILEDWMRPDFDDSRWSPLVGCEPTDDDRDEYTARVLLNEGILPAAVPAATERVWLRGTFQLHPERR